MQELENHDSFHPQIKLSTFPTELFQEAVSLGLENIWGCGGEGEVDAAAAATAAADRRAPGRAA